MGDLVFPHGIRLPAWSDTMADIFSEGSSSPSSRLARWQLAFPSEDLSSSMRQHDERTVSPRRIRLSANGGATNKQFIQREFDFQLKARR